MSIAIGIVGSGSTSPAVNATPPGNVTSPQVISAGIDPNTSVITIVVSYTPPSDSGDTFVGVHFYGEFPDQSSNTPVTVGTTAVGAASPSGQWAPVDCGKQPYTGQAQYTISLQAPAGIDPNTQGVTCRLYFDSYSNSVENTLIRANQSGPTPNTKFTLVSVASNSPASATNITTLFGGDGANIQVVCSPLPPVLVAGVLETPFTVLVSDVPVGVSGWQARLVVTMGALDPTNPANWQVVGPIITQAGPVYAPQDGIQTPHAFALPTPTAFTNGTLWLQAGLVNASGQAQWNNIVPGVTPSFPFTFGSTTGTVDAAAVITSSIAASMAVTNNLLGVATGGITNSLLGAGAVGTINVQNLAITNPLLASLSVEAANLASGSVTSTAIGAAAVGTAAIQNAAITNALIANAAVSGAQIQSATITGANIASATIAGANIASATITGANIASATITDANITSLNVSKLLAGNANFSGTATFQVGSSGPLVAISSSAITLYSASSAVGTGSTGSPYVQITGSAINLSPNSSLTAVSINSSGVASFSNGSTSTTINGNVVTTNEVFAATLIATLSLEVGASGNITLSATASSATAGSATLPSAPAGFFIIFNGSTPYKVPYYNN